MFHRRSNSFLPSFLAMLVLAVSQPVSLSAGEVDLTFEIEVSPGNTTTGLSSASVPFQPVFDITQIFRVGIDQIVGLQGDGVFESFGIVNSALGPATLRQIQTGSASFEMQVVNVGDIIDPATFDGTDAFDGIGAPALVSADDPCPGCFDGTGTAYLAFQYTGAKSNADFDQNGSVNGNDLLIWQRGFNTGTTRTEGDATFDSMVDGDDLTVWQDDYSEVFAAAPDEIGNVGFIRVDFVDGGAITFAGGRYNDMGGPITVSEIPALGAVASVPEPSSLALGFCGILYGLTTQRSRQRAL